jgi:hypothetical protein
VWYTALGRLGALLMTVHYDFDGTRFLEPKGDVEGGTPLPTCPGEAAANQGVPCLAATISPSMAFACVALSPLCGAILLPP